MKNVFFKLIVMLFLIVLSRVSVGASAEAQQSDNDEDRKFIYLIVFLDIDRIQAIESDGKYELFSGQDVAGLCEKYASERLGKFHRYSEESMFSYSKAPSLGDPKGSFHKIINYRVDLSKHNEAFRFLVQDPAVERVRIDRESELFNSLTKTSSVNARVILVTLQSGADRKIVQEDVNAIPGAEWLFRDSRRKSEAYVICRSTLAESSLRRIKSVKSAKALLPEELKERGVSSPKIDEILQNASDEEGAVRIVKHRFREESKTEQQRILEEIVAKEMSNVFVIDFSPDEVTVAGSKKDIDDLVRQFE